MNPSQAMIDEFGLVYVKVGEVSLGTVNPISCQFEGFRHNETPKRVFTAGNFWISKWTVTNQQFELFKPQHLRSHLSSRDQSPVVNVTYLDALDYCQWLTDKFKLGIFDLPTEVEWIRAASPSNFPYPYETDVADPVLANTFQHELRDKAGVSIQGIQEVDKELYKHPLGLVHITGNVLEITKGWYYAPGHFDSATDGAYYIAKGGDIKHCSLSGGVQPRFINDVAIRSETIGFRLIWRPS